ncbi:UNVERIFIED_CONTAM: hypothetical protein Sradi_7092200 [Sesamum radiatum]|uniref:PORR domain-containing protein n=1 Tax=Sesamum radiatum TaxID=300843 RepID=A0AAW2J2M1_SESRA
MSSVHVAIQMDIPVREIGNGPNLGFLRWAACSFAVDFEFILPCMSLGRAREALGPLPLEALVLIISGPEKSRLIENNIEPLQAVTKTTAQSSRLWRPKSSRNGARPRAGAAVLRRTKTTSAHYVDSRFLDPTFENLMEKYKNLLKVISIQDLILASNSTPPSVSLDFFHRLSQRLHLNRGPAAFLRKYPHIFHIFNHPGKLQPVCTLTRPPLILSAKNPWP